MRCGEGEGGGVEGWKDRRVGEWRIGSRGWDVEKEKVERGKEEGGEWKAKK